MKRQYLIWMLLVLMVPLWGCQNCLSRFRGARCRSGLGLPSLRWNRPPAEAPPCTEGCNSANYLPGGEMVSPGGMTTSDVIVDGFSPESVSGSTQIVNRPMVSSGVIESQSAGNIVTIPGPEVGPLPGN